MTVETSPKNEAENKVEDQEKAQVQSKSTRRIPLDIFENKDAYKVIADLPGVTSESLNLQVEKDRLTIEGDSKNYLFRRKLRLSNQIDQEAISAQIQDGVLTLDLPRLASAKPRSIPVTVG